jgi:oxygen-independent coproporphyrinogen-3 oxidase
MCTFCGCNVIVARDAQKADGYITHLEREMRLVADLLGARRNVSQLHLGGGTPTFLNLDQLARLWAVFRQYFTPQIDAELAIEVNPVFTSVSQLRLLAGLGFNRLSVGVQDFDPEVQRAISRGQTFEQTRDLIAAARELDFRGTNIDLIYGLPMQRLDSWQRTLERVLEIRPDRIAVYSFAYVPDLRPHQRKLPPDRPQGATKLGLFGHAYDAFVSAGYQPIGMDHFALPDDELSIAQRRHTLGRNFQGYTVKAATDVIAFGITGISDVQGAYAQNTRSLPRYYQAVASGRLATEKGKALSLDDRRRRSVITELMCHFSVDLGADGLQYFASEAEDLRSLEEAGLLTLDGSKLTLSSVGRVFVRNVAMVFDGYLRRRHMSAGPTYSMTV